MLAYTQLTLVRNKLIEISESPYFSNDLHQYLVQLKKVADKLYSEDLNMGDTVITECSVFINNAVNFFNSSTTKKIPYEIVYCLNDACQKWTGDKTLITTALSQDINDFHFRPVQNVFYDFFKIKLNISFDADLIQICLPEIYRRKPLFSIPLYHELGHYIDISRGISELAAIHHKNTILPLPDGLTDWRGEHIWLNHCREYFADLFSAQFIGRSGIDFLKRLAGDNPSSYTHPSTKNRITVVEDFLSGINNPVVEMLNKLIARFHDENKLLCPSLSIPSNEQNIATAFDNIRPHNISNKNEMHAFINSSWTYLCDTWNNPTGVWSGLSKEVIEKTINDLVEKSIRNTMITEKWTTYASAE